MKNLIIYFSYSGNTDKLVKETNKHFNFDVARIDRKVPYSSDYDTCAYGEAKDEWQQHVHPEIVGLDKDIFAYDRILLFFPIWWYTFPMPIATLVEKMKGYKGEVVLFENSYTNDPQYVENTLRDFRKVDGALNVKQGLFNKSAGEHIRFIENLNR